MLHRFEGFIEPHRHWWFYEDPTYCE